MSVAEEKMKELAKREVKAGGMSGLMFEVRYESNVNERA